MNATELKHLIRDAFATPSVLPQGPIAADRPDLGERDHIERSFAPFTWATVPRELLLNEQGALLGMNPTAIQRFLPAYLLYSLEDYESAGILADSVLFYFLPAPQAHQRLSSTFEHLTTAQLEAVSAFLNLIRDEHAEDFEAKDYNAAIQGIVAHLALRSRSPS